MGLGETLASMLSGIENDASTVIDESGLSPQSQNIVDQDNLLQPATNTVNNAIDTLKQTLNDVENGVANAGEYLIIILALIFAIYLISLLMKV